MIALTTDTIKRAGFIATLGIVLLLGFNMLREPARQDEKTGVRQSAAIRAAMDLFGLHCVNCHGPIGEGLNNNPALNDRAVRTKDASELTKTIARGRRNTAMVGFSINENGMLSTPQIDSLVTLIKHGAWGNLYRYLEANDLMPVQTQPVVQIDTEALTYPLDVVTLGRDIFLANCQSCHNVGTRVVTGHSIGKDLTDNTFVQESSDEDVLALIEDGRADDDPDNITGYEMPPQGGNADLTQEEMQATVAYLRELNTGTITVLGTGSTVTTRRGTWHGIDYEWVPVVDNLDLPLLVTPAGDGTDRLFVVEQTGLIMIVEDGRLRPEPFLDITRRLPLEVYSGMYTERGLLGLAFHPNYEQNGQFFICYINRDLNSVVARYTVRPDDPNRADPASEQILLTVEQPFEDHNGGNLVFGPDGYLYIGFGDGGRPADPNYNSQDPSQLLGKMLRLDVDGGDPYAIPPDNPFLDDPAFRPEIWALGLRNPWRFTFDRLTGDLYIGDVGQWKYEEVDFQPADSPGGENYGWSAFEARHPYLEDETVLGTHTRPIWEYGHEIGLSVTGGYVYRGDALPELQGMYVYGDYVNGFVWLLHQDALGLWQNELFMQTSFVISSFGEGDQGELYLVDYKGGVYRLERAHD